MKKSVIIIGGGVAGMSAAHELAERGFKVKIYERQPLYAGGKARSISVEGSAASGKKALPGEHGFRFFPGFYRHITDTMKRIPVTGNKDGVFDNLVPTQRMMMARFDKAPLVNIVNFPKSLTELKIAINALTNSQTDLTRDDADFFAEKLWEIMSSCYDRRKTEYERIGWWEFMDADKRSYEYQKYFVSSITRTMVAAKPDEVSTKTGGDILLQLLFLMANPRAYPDKVLNGPTNKAWLDPWKQYLESIGVEYHHGYEAVKINTTDDAIASIEVRHGNNNITVTGDYYIAAIPVEVMSKLLTKEMIKIDPMLSLIHELANKTAWMNGIQFYLSESVCITHGHVMYIDSQWALTSICQLQFWKDFNISDYGNGNIKEILSVDISDWDTPGFNGKSAKQCSREEIKNEVWLQLKRSLMVDGQCMLKDEMMIDWYLDSDIVIRDGHETINEEPLLVNKINTWSLRPETYTDLPNFFLAADYVRTYTDLATMEGANEAARRAVNVIIDRSGVDEPLCKIWQLHEPDLLAVYRWRDKRRYKKGLPWRNEIPLIVRIFHYMNYYFNRLFRHDPIPKQRS
jgi:uncharacterized protein with NAD-binding domain and iron-sulfur cluster